MRQLEDTNSNNTARRTISAASCTNGGFQKFQNTWIKIDLIGYRFFSWVSDWKPIYDKGESESFLSCKLIKKNPKINLYSPSSNIFHFDDFPNYRRSLLRATKYSWESFFLCNVDIGNQITIRDTHHRSCDKRKHSRRTNAVKTLSRASSKCSKAAITQKTCKNSEASTASQANA